MAPPSPPFLDVGFHATSRQNFVCEIDLQFEFIYNTVQLVFTQPSLESFISRFPS